MTFDKMRMAEVIRDSRLSFTEVQENLGLTHCQAESILYGKMKCDRRTAERLLTIFGIWNVCWAMKENWRWMHYANYARFTD